MLATSVGLALFVAVAWFVRGEGTTLGPAGGKTDGSAHPAGRAAAEPIEAPLPVEVDRTHTLSASDGSLADAAAGDGGPRWKVAVTVVEKPGATDDAQAPAAALAEAFVTLKLLLGGAEEGLFQGSVDESGRLEFDATAAIATRSPLLRGAFAVFAAAEAPGHWPAVAVADLPADGGTTEVALALPRGGSLRGRVVTPAGASVAGALLKAFDRGSGRFVGESTSDAAGGFALPIRSPGRWKVHAAANGVGSGTAGDFAVEPTIDVAIGDLVLTAAGSIGGGVVDARGEPAEGVRVVALACGLDFDGISLDEGVVVEGGGLALGVATSGPDGRFRVDGLRDVEFWLLTPAEPSVEPEGDGIHRIGDDDARLVVTRHRLRVIVQDAQGTWLPGVELAFRYDDDARTTSTGRDGSCWFHGKAGQRVAVSAALEGRPAVEGEYTFGPLHDDAELRLTVPPAEAPRGTVMLTVRDAAGQVVAPLCVTVKTRHGSLVDPWYRRPLGGDGRIEGLPVGEVVLEALAGAPRYRGFPESTDLAPLSAAVTVRAEATTTVELTAFSGGRLRLALQLPAGVEPVALADAELVRVVGEEETDRSLGVGYMELSEGGVSFGDFDWSADGPWLSGALLEPGVHRLRFTAPGFRTLEESFTIRAGEVADVMLAPQRE